MQVMLKDSPEIVKITQVMIDSNDNTKEFFCGTRKIPQENILKVFDDVDNGFPEIWTQ